MSGRIWGLFFDWRYFIVCFACHGLENGLQSEDYCKSRNNNITEVKTVPYLFYLLSSTGSILSNTDLSDLSTVGTCDIFVYQMRYRVM